MTETEEIVEGTVDEVKERIDSDTDNLEALLDAEKNGQNRVTLIEHINGLIEKRDKKGDDEDSGELTEGENENTNENQAGTSEEPSQGENDTGEKGGFDFSKIKKGIQEKMKKGKIDEKQAQVMEQRAPAEHAAKKTKNEPVPHMKYVKTGIEGLDQLFTNGIPKGLSVLVAGGTGSGKTILSLQMLAYHAEHGEKCLYISFEESEKRLINHMKSFGWDPERLIEEGNLHLNRYSTFDVSRDIEAMLAQKRGELEIEVEPSFLPKDFKPDFIVVDSLTAVSSAFTGEESAYRLYIEQLFRYFEEMDVTAFLITETEEMPEVFSPTGVEEFLADGVIVLYNIKRGNTRESAIEVLKMRGEDHEKKIVAMQITGEGIIVYPQQEVFAPTN